jgi:hypothetical protein
LWLIETLRAASISTRRRTYSCGAHETRCG